MSCPTIQFRSYRHPTKFKFHPHFIIFLIHKFRPREQGHRSKTYFHLYSYTYVANQLNSIHFKFVTALAEFRLQFKIFPLYSIVSWWWIKKIRALVDVPTANADEFSQSLQLGIAVRISGYLYSYVFQAEDGL